MNFPLGTLEAYPHNQSTNEIAGMARVFDRYLSRGRSHNPQISSRALKTSFSGKAAATP
jgi:hypothetical protein